MLLTQCLKNLITGAELQGFALNVEIHTVFINKITPVKSYPITGEAQVEQLIKFPLSFPSELTNEECHESWPD